MYKVFVNEKPIFITDKAILQSELGICLYKNTTFEEIVHKLQHTSNEGIVLYHYDLDSLWENFKNFFKIVPAAGGLVVNRNDEILFIRRNDHWDLPKGRMEENETFEQTALREVMEECAIDELEIVGQLPVTYHIYQEFSKYKLKKTHWYLMKTKSQKKPVPQSEEGIKEATFVSEEDLEKIYPEIYANIKDIIDNYLNNRDL